MSICLNQVFVRNIKSKTTLYLYDHLWFTWKKTTTLILNFLGNC